MVMITSRALEKVEPSDISRPLSEENAASTSVRTRRSDGTEGAASVQRRMSDPVIDKALKIRRPVWRLCGP
jgi:hypothetical protein